MQRDLMMRHDSGATAAYLDTPSRAATGEGYWRTISVVVGLCVVCGVVMKTEKKAYKPRDSASANRRLLIYVSYLYPTGIFFMVIASLAEWAH